MNKFLKSVFTFVLFGVIVIFSNEIIAANLDTYEKELNNIKQQLKENAAKQTGIEQQISQYSYEIAELDSRMVEYSKQLATLQTKVDSVNNKIEEYEKNLQNSAESYNSAEDTYTTRVRAIYENGLPTLIDVLFSSKGIADFFSRLNVYTSILEYDKSLIGNMKTQKEYIDYIKKDMEVQKLQLDQLKYDVEKSQEILNDTISAKQRKVDELNSSKSNLKDAAAALESKKKDAQRKVEEEIARIAQEEANKGSSTTFTGGQFAWPVNGYTTITTRFGEVYNLVVSTGSAHTGCDIAGAGILGKPILAIENGTVTTAKYSNYGYGNYVILNHGKCLSDGNNYLSLYGHASSLAVSVGQYVRKGQVIGYVGSTGNSTGPHLHLEVRINGKITDPLKYYPAINFYFPYG